jgi:hypothetical protein
MLRSGPARETIRQGSEYTDKLALSVIKKSNCNWHYNWKGYMY